ncbi:MAG: tetratricopeptide repeat protein [Desulfobacteraceae bacterium]
MQTMQMNMKKMHAKEEGSHAASMAQAWRLRSQGLWKPATEICRSVLLQNPDLGQAWHLLGVLARDQNQISQAVDCLERAIAVDPEEPKHYNNLGVILNSVGRYDEAKSYLRKALEIWPKFHDARCNLGLVCYYQNHLTYAAQCFTQILSDVPDHDAALANLGMTRLAQQMYGEAAKAYEKAVSIAPNQAQWHGNLGAAYIRMGCYDKAANCYRSAAALDPDATKYDIYQGIALRAAGNLPDSIRLLEGVPEKDPQRSLAIPHLVVGLEYTCQWNKLDLFHPLLDHTTQSALDDGRRPHEDPMLNIRRCSDITVNQAVSRAWSRYHQHRADRTNLQLIRSRDHRHRHKITIGYLSYDFRNHPVAHQLFPLFSMHDRDRFHCVAFSTGPDDGSFFRRTIEAGCDEFIDIGSKGLAEAAQTIYDRKVDILVDLMGHSHHNRMEILALRPAPIQVGYLGFLSTTGAPFIDYLVTDAIVVPENHKPCFDEKLLRMPHCYQFSHVELVNGETQMNRKDWGLPDTGFVFCCFNTVYKIDRELFDTWMRILLQVPDAVLWLNGGHMMARRQMQARARLLGIDPDRLVFAEKIPLEDHLKRVPLADLALDTIRYNGGATTANALGCGIPVLTVLGRHWVSRMSASQLAAVGLPDLVLPSLEAYAHTAIDLARHQNKLKNLKQYLKKNIPHTPLFDSSKFVRQLESGYRIIRQRFLKGLDPIHVDIPEEPMGGANG